MIVNHETTIIQTTNKNNNNTNNTDIANATTTNDTLAYTSGTIEYAFSWYDQRCDMSVHRRFLRTLARFVTVLYVHNIMHIARMANNTIEKMDTTNTMNATIDTNGPNTM